MHIADITIWNRVIQCQGLDMALERLQLSYVDLTNLVYAHRPDRQTLMVEMARVSNHVTNHGKSLY